jgi:hypothetical protein
MRPATSSTEEIVEQRAVAAFDSLRAALARPQAEPAEPRVQQALADRSGDTAIALRTARARPQAEPLEPREHQAPADKPGDTAVAMRLASEAIAAAARSVDSELRRMRELVDESEARARTAEERAREAERLLAEIRDQILGKYPEQRAA